MQYSRVSAIYFLSFSACQGVYCKMNAVSLEHKRPMTGMNVDSYSVGLREHKRPMTVMNVDSDYVGLSSLHGQMVVVGGFVRSI